MKYEDIERQKREVERSAILDVLQRHGWIVPRAAAELGVTKHSLRRTIRRLGMDRVFSQNSPGPGRPRGTKKK